MADNNQNQRTEPATRYKPDYERYKRIRDRRQALGDFDAGLPDGFPAKIQTPMTWNPETLGASYIYQLSTPQIDELQDACSAFMDSGRKLSSIDRTTFRLPTLSDELGKHRASLHGGKGLVLYRGLDPSLYSMKENIIIFAGLASYLSERRGRQAAAKFLVHVKDLTSKLALDGLRVAPYHNGQLPPHTDQGDVLGMYVLAASVDGGEGTFASVAQIYNEIASTRPDLIGVLSQPDWPFDRPLNKAVFDPRPLLFLERGEPEMIYSRGALLPSPGSQRSPDLPCLSEAQAEALDCVHFTALKNLHKLQWRKGDMLFFNNRKVLHGRESFVNSDIPSEQRHILRLWLQDQEMGGPAPRELQPRWERIFSKSGELPDTDEFAWPMEPIFEGKEEVQKSAQMPNK